MSATVAVPRSTGTFARPGVVRQGWYLIDPARPLRAGRVRALDIGRRRVVMYRDGDGRAHLADDRCPHLGSDLALGRVTPTGLECALHGWCWGHHGACVNAPGNDIPPPRRLRHYRVVERWGFLWAWLGGEPGFELPGIPSHLCSCVVLASQRVTAHSDVIFANGFDLAHFGPSHGIDGRTAVLDVSPWSIEHRLVGRLSRRPALKWLGLGGAPLDFSFIQHGGGIVHVLVRQPIEFLILFTLRPDAAHVSRTRTMLFLRRQWDLPRALAILWSTALDDLKHMQTIQWTGAFAASDRVLERYAEFVEALPAW